MTVFEVFQLYVEFIESTNNPQKARRIVNEFRCVLLHYWLPQMGYQRKSQGRKMTNADVKSALEFLKALKIQTLLSGRQTLQKAFEDMQASKASCHTYGSRFDQFLVWNEQQEWWPGSSRLSKFKDQCCPVRKTAYGDVSNTPLTSRKGKNVKYGLKPKETPLSLQMELKDFYDYLTESEYPGRVIEPIEDSTAQSYLKEVRLLLGWHYRYRTPPVPLEQLSLDVLCPQLSLEQLEDFTNREDGAFWKKEKQKLDSWLCGYLKFLREVAQSESPKTKRLKITALLELAKFQCLDLVEEERDYYNYSVFKLLSNSLKKINLEVDDWVKNKRYVSDQSKKWPDTLPGETALSALRRLVLEPLREDCRPRDSRGRIRKGVVNATAYQHFLQWYMLANLPARRQQEFCTLKVALCCPVTRPEFVPLNGLYHPLPPSEAREKRRDKTPKDNYLHFTYQHQQKFYPQGVWVIDIQDYKTRKTHGSQSFVIPNRQFADGSCLYDYMERYLYGWWMEEIGYKNQQLYDWWQPELKGRRGQWLMKGRADFNPHDACCLTTRQNAVQWSWGYLFLQPKVGVGYDDVNFAGAFERPAHSLIGKRPTPHTMRYIWATWAFQVGLNDAQLRSLAYAMGQTVETLRKMYERCTPTEKRRLIEEAIDELLFAELPSDESAKKSQASPNADSNREPAPDLETLIQGLQKLGKADRERLIAVLQSQS